MMRKWQKSNKETKIFGSAWSAPIWMKTNHAFKGQSARSKIFVFKLTTENINQKITIDQKMGSLAPSVRALELNQ